MRVFQSSRKHLSVEGAVFTDRQRLDFVMVHVHCGKCVSMILILWSTDSSSLIYMSYAITICALKMAGYVNSRSSDLEALLSE